MRILAILFLAGMVTGCNNAQQDTTNNASVPVTASDNVYKAVLEGHDIGMAKMGEMVRYKKLLRQQADSLKGLKEFDTAWVASLETALYDLNYAEELMNTWMQDFDPDGAGETETQKLSFYTKEKEKVDTVNSRIFSSLEKAGQLVK